MERPSVKILLWTSLVFLQIRELRGCFEEERIGLLELKAFVKSQTGDVHLLPSWSDDAKSDCCAWDRVTCSSSTGHAIKLSLSGVYQDGYPLNIQTNEGRLLNVSLFLPFKELKSLDLSWNAIAGCFPSEGFEMLSKLKNLTTLYLVNNYLSNGNILRSLDAVTSLKVLNLTGNYLGENFPSQGLANLSSLEVLILQDNKFNGSLPIEGLTNLSKLKILDVSKNQFIGSISPSIKALSFLKAISIAQNLLNGTLSIQEFCMLKNLEELDLSSNLFTRNLPLCLKNVTSLKLLDISWNQFFGKIPSSILANLTALEYIDFSHNHFEGVLPFSLFSNHSRLEVIILGIEGKNFGIEFQDIGDRDFLFQLKTLALPGCNLKDLSNDILKSLLLQRELEVIDLSHNYLSGSFPSWLLENKTRVQVLILRDNFLGGKFHFPSDCYLNITWLDVSQNYLDGQLQEDIGKLTPYLQYLNLSKNHFKGYLPSSIGDMSDLYFLDLSFNNFYGELPKRLVANCSVRVLKLSNNNLRGDIFSKHFKLQGLIVLVLNNNQFTGTLPISSPWIEILLLDISNNHMWGTIPEWIGNGTIIMSLLLSNNYFQGQIPCGQGYAGFIDLSNNSLSGSLLPCLNLEGVHFLKLQGNELTGSIPTTIFSPTNLWTLDLGDNGFSGSIPHEIGTFSDLRVLQLNGNHFSGIIPNQLCWLEKMRIMDLSKNFLSGTIPHCFSNISCRGIVDVGHFDSSIGFNVKLGPFQRLLESNVERIEIDFGLDVEFVTKYKAYTYSGRVLNLMSGLDFSCNKLIGEIPLELGELSIHALNLSHNQLVDSIPASFSKLAQLESLDLSHNNLSGKIPSTLIDLYFLEVFTVAYNNLSGMVLDMKNQFATFEKSIYEGNPFLCGQILDKNCTTTISELHPLLIKSPNAYYHEFFACFIASYVIFFLSIASLLHINPHWQQWCFNLIKDSMYKCYYSVKGL